MKVAQVVSTYPPYKGGMGRVAFEYAERLRARGENVHVFTPRTQRVNSDPEYVHRVPSPIHVGNAGVVPSLYHRLKGFDLVHLHYPFFGGAEPVSVRTAFRHDQKLVITYHMDAVANGVRGAVFSAHRRLLFPWIIGRADRVLVSSREYAESSALADVPGILERVEIHPFGVDLDRFQPREEPALRAELGLSDDPVLLFVGGLDPAHHFKGFQVLLQALEKISSRPWSCVVVGDGSLRPSFAAQAEAALPGRVRFVGGVSDADLPRYYRLADIHLLPSTERAEAFGLVALEAAASGTPTIASDLPGVRSVVLDGETGLLVPPRDASALAKSIELLLSEPALRDRLGEAARKRAEAEFAWDPLVAKLQETYRALV
jgi:glycosyltransferase involved in cell wall biosynthesis